MAGGKFLERGRVKKSTTTSGRQDYYSHEDFYVGATVVFNNYRFTLIEADEYAYNYMEQHHQQVSVLTILTVLLIFLRLLHMLGVVVYNTLVLIIQVTLRRARLIPQWGDCPQTGKSSRYVTS